MDESFNPKICDFALATPSDTTRDIIGTVRWAAPEYLDPRRIKDRSGKGDVFSFGVIVWEIVTGSFPWESEGYIDLDLFVCITSGERLKIPENCDIVLKTIMLDCWNDGKLNYFEPI